MQGIAIITKGRIWAMNIPDQKAVKGAVEGIVDKE
jgi:hypothetical protein